MWTAAIVNHFRPMPEGSITEEGSVRTVAVWTLLVMGSFSRFRLVESVTHENQLINHPVG
jgi:hypothetical protein